MVRKIQRSEYLKRYDNMPVAERTAYEGRVGEWLSIASPRLMELSRSFEARLQNVLTLSSSWNDTDCQSFEEGARLLSALMGTADTWLPEMLYVKSAKRCIRQMVLCLKEKADTVAAATTAVLSSPKLVAPERPKNTEELLTKFDGFYTKIINAERSEEVPEPAKGTFKATPVRPKHIDQYAHLLPKKTQERAAQVKDLLRELDSAREKTRLLMGAPQTSSSDRAAWSKKCAELDHKVKSIYKELDAEWDKLAKSGRVVVDDLGNCRVVADSAESCEDKTKLNSEEKTRRRELRKWLSDTRRGNGNTRATHIRKWKVNFDEYLAIEGDAAFEDSKIIEAAKHYGIELPSRGNEKKQEDNN